MFQKSRALVDVPLVAQASAALTGFDVLDGMDARLISGPHKTHTERCKPRVNVSNSTGRNDAPGGKCGFSSLILWLSRLNKYAGQSVGWKLPDRREDTTVNRPWKSENSGGVT